MIADALTEFDIRYAAIENDPDRLRKAIADDYRVTSGVMTEAWIWARPCKNASAEPELAVS